MIDRRTFTSLVGLGAVAHATDLHGATVADAGNASPEPLRQSVMDFIPEQYWKPIKDETIADDVDLFPYLQQALATGRSLEFPAGKFPFAGTLQPGRGQNISGAGRGASGNRTLLRYTANEGPAILLDGGAETTLASFRLQGPSHAKRWRAHGIQIGDRQFSGIYVLREVTISHFEHNLRLCGALWSSFYDVHSLHGRYGLTLDSQDGVYSTTCCFISCSFRENAGQGFVGVRTPVRSVSLNFIGCDFESNCQEDPALPQVAPGAVAHTSFSGCYFEDATQKLDTVKIDGGGGYNFDTCYFNGGRSHIVAGAGSASFVQIGGGSRFLGTTGQFAVTLPACPQVIVSRTVETDKPFLLTGSGSGYATVTHVEDADWQPRLLGTRRQGNPAFSRAVARYTVVGKRMLIECELEIEDWGGMSGPLWVAGLPLPSSTSGITHSLSVDLEGFVVQSGARAIATLQPGAGHLALVLQTSQGKVPLEALSSGKRATIRLSGNYGI